MIPWIRAAAVAATAYHRYLPFLPNNSASVCPSPAYYDLSFVESRMKRTRSRSSKPINAANDSNNNNSQSRRHRIKAPSQIMFPSDEEKVDECSSSNSDPNFQQMTKPKTMMKFFQTSTAADAKGLCDGVALQSFWRMRTDEEQSSEVAAPTISTILPWVGFGTYRLGQKLAYEGTLRALECGYRCIDTAFIYGGETTELEVGRALQTALKTNIIQERSQVFIITKQWRKYHGYDGTMQCLELSLKRLQVDYIDLYLIHWPGPAWSTMFRSKDALEEHGPWHYSDVTPEQMVNLRAETWRAMEDAVRAGKIKAIGVSNFTVRQLEILKKTARLWPPAVNQVECHPLYPQDDLRKYCESQGIVVQAYAALGGQDATKAQWKLLLEGAMASSTSKEGKKLPRNLLFAAPVVAIAQELGVSPAQILLRYALERNCAITPKASSKARMVENASIFSFRLTQEQMAKLDRLYTNNAALQKDPQQGRLCWRNEPLRLLDFD